MLLAKKPRNFFGQTKSEQDLYCVLNPITWFCRVFGIFPFWLRNPTGERKYSTSYILIIYGVTVLVLSIKGLFMWAEFIDATVTEQLDRSVNITSIHIELIILSWSMVIMIVTAIITRDKFSDAIDTLSSQDITLRKLGTRLDYAADLKKSYIRLGINILLMIVLFGYHLINESHIYLTYPLVWVAWVFPNAVRIVSICLFGDVLFALRQRFAVINEHLTKMIEETKCLSPETISARGNRSERLRSIATVHGALSETALSINKTFGLSIIIGIFYVLKGVTTSMYHITREIKYQPNISWMKIFGYFNWGMISFTHTVYLVTACNLAQNQASLTGKLIHKFQINKGATPLNIVLRSFVLQLYHERIEFFAAGVLPLDATLLQSIVGAVATFLFILLQFQPSPPETIESQSANNSFEYLVL